MEATATAPKTTCGFNLQWPPAVRDRVRSASRRISAERDEDVSMTMFILEAIREKLEREAA